MRRLKLHYLLAAAALTVVAGNAAAQTMKAEIPFTFRAGLAQMAPGTYVVTAPQGSSSYLTVHNRDNGQTAMVVYSRDASAARKSGPPKLIFACAGARCMLQQVWPGPGSQGFNLPAPKTVRGETATIREVLLTNENSN